MRPLTGGNVAILSAQVTGLAGVGLAGIADGDLAALVRVNMGTSASAVAVRGHGLLVKVVDEWAANFGKTRERNAEEYALAVGTGGSKDGSTERVVGLLRKSGNVGGASRVASDLGCWSDQS